jgi:hypothetical protein
VIEGDTNAGKQPAGEVPAWEACGRVVRKERQDYFEFVVSSRSHRLYDQKYPEAYGGGLRTLL